MSIRLSEAKIDFTPIQKTSITERYVCRTCHHEKYGYTCSHPEKGKKGWTDKTEHYCWKPKDFGKKKKREDSIESA